MLIIGSPRQARKMEEGWSSGVAGVKEGRVGQQVVVGPVSCSNSCSVHSRLQYKARVWGRGNGVCRRGHKDELLTEPEKSSGATFSMFLYLFDII